MLAMVVVLALLAALPSESLAHTQARHKRARHMTGIASYYGAEFTHRRTASGELFDPTLLTAAHPFLPFGTRVRVTNLVNGRRVVVRINDRGPYKHGRVLDLTRAAARRLGFVHSGVTRVRIDVLGKRSEPRGRLADELPPPRTGAHRSATRKGSSARS